MADSKRDPYETLGIGQSVSDDELHAAYRRLVQAHHPDHNRGSAESVRRFEEIQAAYARVRELRRSPSAARESPGRAETPPAGSATDPNLERRLADLERELRSARQASERVRRAAREAVTDGPRPSDQELGYVSTDDSFSKILADARSELDELASKLARKPPSR